MTPEAKKHLLIAGAIGAAAIGLYAVYRHEQANAAAAAAAASASSAANPNADSEAYLQELALAGAGAGEFAASSGVPATESLATPNFAADLESSLQLLQGIGILPTPATQSNTAAATASGATPPSTVGTQPIHGPYVAPIQRPKQIYYPVIESDAPAPERMLE